MKCEVCGKEYGHGKGFHGERYKTTHFCSEECYNNYLLSKVKPPKESKKSKPIPVPSITCSCCGEKFIKGTGFKGSKYNNLKFCTQDCYERFIKMKSAPKPPVNFKPDYGSPRRKFTDYIQMLTNDMANWKWLMKQAKDIQEEYEIDWETMYRTLKYAHEYENVEWNMEYGLYQFFPKYIKIMQDFTEAIMSTKHIEDIVDIEDEVNYVRKPKQYIGKVEF